MRRFLLRRLGHSLIVLWLVSLVVFFVSRVIGDPVAIMAPLHASPEDLDALRRALGLDKSLTEQYAIFLGNAIRGDFGTSLWQLQPAMQLVTQRFPATLQLTMVAMLIAIGVGVPLGVLAALKRDGFLDRAATAISILAQSVPSFWLGIMMILLFAVTLNWLPTSGRGTPAHLVMPAIALAARPLAQFSRLTRSGMVEALEQDYIRFADAKGLLRRAVVMRHALPNAALPIATVAGLQLGNMLSGAVVVEVVFAWPGIGDLAVSAILRRDFPLIQAAVLFVSTMVLLGNLLADISYGYLDPRIRLR